MKGLKEARTAADVSQFELADQANISRGRVQLAEHGYLYLSKAEEARLRSVLSSLIEARLTFLQQALVQTRAKRQVAGGAAVDF